MKTFPLQKYLKRCFISKVKDKQYTIGIDLGTTSSCVSVIRSIKPEVIMNAGQLTTPSVVAITNDTVYVGLEAQNQVFLY